MGRPLTSRKAQGVGELQMDWLRSEDLKEEENVTAPIVIIAVHALCRCLWWRGIPLVMQRMNPEHLTPDHLVVTDALVRREPEEEEDEEDEEKDNDEEDDDDGDEGYSE